MTALVIDGLHRAFSKGELQTLPRKTVPREAALDLSALFDCALDIVKIETEKAIRALAKE